MDRLRNEDLDEMQRLILQSLPRFRVARYSLFRIADGLEKEARKDLESLMPHLATADNDDKSRDAKSSVRFKVCIAFTYNGLSRLGLDKKVVHNFPLAFREGMADETRSKRLRDKPEKWEWSDAPESGDLPGTEIHVLIAFFWKISKSIRIYSSVNKDNLNADWKKLVGDFHGLDEVRRLPDTFSRLDAKGHFGFRDGISQPYILGSETSKKPRTQFMDTHVINPGNIVLGHSNDFREQTPSLWVDEDIDDATTELKRYGLKHNRRDFGRNGSYLVFRQLKQDVQAFESFLESTVEQASKAKNGAIEDKELLAAKLVGRWRSGAPLTLAPGSDNKGLGTENDFLFSRDDAHGHFCPIGSHIRRTYPRDTSIEHGSPMSSKAALISNRRRRLIRRGRTYYGDTNDDVGLHFICLNASIREQFEFVQESWVNNRRFSGTKDEVDPLVGARSGTKSKFTIQKSPIDEELTLKNFVTVIGGGYFFLPSARALRFLIKFHNP